MNDRPTASAPAVSVVLPLYNKERYIRRTLDSVAAQTFGDFELVIVDDGSTDSGPRIVADYGDDRIRLIRQDNAGPGAARNTGIRQSQAPLVAFLDADDEWVPTYLETVVGLMDRHPECAACCTAHMTGPGGEGFSLQSWRQLNIVEGAMRLAPDSSPLQMGHFRSFFTPSSAISCRRDVALELGGFYEHRCTYREDAYLITQLLLHHTIYLHLAPLVRYHLEASELGYLGRSGPLPVEPLLTDPGPTRRRCPRAYRGLLEQFMGVTALMTARQSIKRGGDWARARALLRQYPLARSLGWLYIRTWLEMCWLTVTGPVVRYIRSSGWLRGLVRGAKRRLRS